MLIVKGDKAADYATPIRDRSRLRALKAAGYRFVVRYSNGCLAQGKDHWKIIKPDERDLLFSEDLGIAIVFEKSATRPLLGATAGAIDGAECRADLLAIGYPMWMPVLIANDTDVTKANLATVNAYNRAFARAVQWPVGIYGDWDILNISTDYCAVGWQANAKGWSWDWLVNKWRGPHPSASMLQKMGVGDIDPNECLRGFRVWDGKPDTVTPPPPKPVPHDVLRPGERLLRGQRLVSADGSTSLDVQATDGHLTLNDLSSGKPRCLWASRALDCAFAMMQDTDGNFVARSETGRALFDTKTYPNRGAYLVVTRGRFVIKSADGKRVLWASDGRLVP